jgi:hypothetical protein
MSDVEGDTTLRGRTGSTDASFSDIYIRLSRLWSYGSF